MTENILPSNAATLTPTETPATLTPTETTTTLAPTETQTDQEVAPKFSQDGDHDRFAHYARAKDVTRAAVEGTPVVAICGKVWVPSRDPSRYPVCKTCAEIKSRLDARTSN